MRITDVMLSQLFVLDDRGETVTKSYEWKKRIYTVFLKHLTISTIRKVYATIQVYGLSNMPFYYANTGINVGIHMI